MVITVIVAVVLGSVIVGQWDAYKKLGKELKGSQQKLSYANTVQDNNRVTISKLKEETKEMRWLKAEKSSMETKVEKLERTVKIRDQRIESLTKERDKARQERSIALSRPPISSHKEIRLTSEIDTLKKTVERLNGRVGELESKNRTLQRERRELTKQVKEKAVQEITKTNQELEEKVQRLVKEEKKLQERTKELTTQVKDFESGERTQRLEKQIQEIEGRLKQLQNENSQLQQSLDQERKAVATATKENGKLKTSLDELEAQAKAKELELQEARGVGEQQKGRIAELEQGVADLTTQRTTLDQKSQKLAVQIQELKDGTQEEINQRLFKMVTSSALAQRYINEMYRRGAIDLDKREQMVWKTEIMQGIENKIITEKNVQLLTREGQLQLQTNTSLFEIRKQQFDLTVSIEQFTLDKRDQEYNNRLEQERWEIKKKLDVFDLDKRKFALEQLASRTEDEQRKAELLVISDRLDIERTRQSLQTFSDQLEDQERKLELKRLLVEFDNSRDRHQLQVFADRLDSEKERHELNTLLDQLDIERTRFALERYKGQLDNQAERQEIQLMIDHFELEQSYTALSNAREEFDLHVEREQLNLQERINYLDNETQRHELQVAIDNFNLDRREAKAELDDRMRTLKHDINAHELQTELDTFNQEMKERHHVLKMLNDKLELREERHDVQVQRDKLERYNEKLETNRNQIQTYYQEQESALQLKIEKGDLRAREQLLQIQGRRADADAKLRDLQFTKREIANYARETKQDELRRELKYKQDILYSLYDDIEYRHPKMVDQRFSRMGYDIESPYKKQYQECQEQRERQRRELERCQQEKQNLEFQLSQART